MKRAALLVLLAGAAPIHAQDHSDHSAHEAPIVEAAPDQPDEGAMDHAQVDHAQMDHGAMDHSSMDHSQMDHGAMDHGTMDHSQMDHGTMDHSTMDHGAMQGMDLEIPEGPPPPEAFEGPLYAADTRWGADIMDSERIQVMRDVSGMTFFWFQGDRIEYHAREGADRYLWDIQGFYGGDYDKFWFKSEGEGSFGESPESADVQALWSHAIGPWFDFQAGIRQDLFGPERTHAVVGVQGLAPYLFEIDAAAFLSTKGDLTAQIEAELDQRITQRLILQPRAEVVLAAQDVPELGIGSGLDRIETGVRLRYEFAREFAPYFGVAQEWRVGRSADFARAEGEDPNVTSFIAGIRFWF